MEGVPAVSQEAPSQQRAAGSTSCCRNGGWESRGEGGVLESDVSRSFSWVEGEPPEKSLFAVGVSAAAF